mgnify:FL=1
MMEMTVHTSTPYQILIARGCLDETGPRAAKLFRANGKAMIVSDSNVMPLYGDRVEKSLEAAGITCFRFTFPAGETSKRLSVIEQIYAALAENRFTRTDFLVALGGGVVGDMTGFAAATFLRGMGFVQIPTSLLAQVDSSVGGKTGVDLPQGKNLVGAFHQPRLVLIDPDTLGTLPPRYFADGMGEVIKYGCIRSRDLFDSLAQSRLTPDHPDLERVLYECVDIKRIVVEHDEHDTGERMILNFGHTLGHALEKLHNFEVLSHGEAVGIGMVLVTEAAERNGITPAGTVARIRSLLTLYGLPTEDPSIPLSDAVAATSVDKKSLGGSLNLVVLSELGNAVVHPVPKAEVPAFFGEGTR